MTCCGGGITRLVSGSLEFTCIEVGDETMLIGEGGGEVQGRGRFLRFGFGMLERDGTGVLQTPSLNP
jgi:hypothetical protein